MPSPLIDWVLADWVARRIAGSGEEQWPAIDLRPIAADAEHRVVAYTGLTPRGPLPVPEGVGRREWIASNIASTRALMDPVLERTSTRLGPVGDTAQLAMAAAASAKIGLLLGYLGKRVLGQYELMLVARDEQTPPPRLLFVLPNLGQAVRRFAADEREFLTWVTLHEVTHAVQFGGVPWLQEHLASLVGEIVAGAERRLERGRHRPAIPSRQRLGRVASAARHGDVIGMLVTESEQALIDRAQAVMAVIEGHAEHVMDAVAPDLLPSLPELRSALDARRRNQTLISRALARLLGLEMKLRQYERGKIFCDRIVEVAGNEALQYLFSSPQALPTPTEIEAPDAWVRRTRGEF